MPEQLKPELQLCLVGGPLAPLLTPILDPQWRPQTVVLACAAADQASARLAAVMEAEGVAVAYLQWADAGSLAGMRSQLSLAGTAAGPAGGAECQWRDTPDGAGRVGSVP
ncbi:MAG: hypothetical protein R3E95_02595 [Thiolinea sp.]